MSTSNKIVLLVSLALATLTASAQTNLNSAIGARLGYPLALSYKKMISEQDAVEFYGGARFYQYHSYFNISGAYQRYQNLGLEDNLAPLNWYFGAGATAYFNSYKDEIYDGVDDVNYSKTSLGINGYLGLQYAFENTPVELTIDWVPTLFIGNGYNTGFGAGNGSLGVRYILSR